MPQMVKRILGYLGDYSMIVWLSHTFFCYYLFHDVIYGFKYPLVIFMVLMVISLLVGGIIRYLAKKKLNGWEYKSESEGILRELHALAMSCRPGRVKVYATE